MSQVHLREIPHCPSQFKALMVYVIQTQEEGPPRPTFVGSVLPKKPLNLMAKTSCLYVSPLTHFFQSPAEMIHSRDKILEAKLEYILLVQDLDRYMQEALRNVDVLDDFITKTESIYAEHAPWNDASAKSRIEDRARHNRSLLEERMTLAIRSFQRVKVKQPT